MLKCIKEQFMKKVILLILDGFGLRDSDNGNAIKMASLPNLNNIFSTYSVSELEASGSSVGLPSKTVRTYDYWMW